MLKSHKLGPNPQEAYNKSKGYIKSVSLSFSIFMAIVLLLYILALISSLTKLDWKDPLDFTPSAKNQWFDLLWYIGVIVIIIVFSKKFQVM